MKKKATFFIFPILFLAGLSLLLYPLVANQWNNYRQSRLISSYDESVARQESEGTLDYSQEWTKALTYNEELLPYILPDSFAAAQIAEEEDEEYLSCLNLTGDGMGGVTAAATGGLSCLVLAVDAGAKTAVVILGGNISEVDTLVSTFTFGE